MRRTSDREHFVSLPAWRGRIIVAVCLIAGLIAVGGFSSGAPFLSDSVRADDWHAVSAKSSTRHLYYPAINKIAHDSGGSDDNPDANLAAITAHSEFYVPRHRIGESPSVWIEGWREPADAGWYGPRAPPAA